MSLSLCSDVDSERTIRRLIALMVLCCDPLAIALTAAASRGGRYEPEKNSSAALFRSQSNSHGDLAAGLAAAALELDPVSRMVPHLVLDAVWSRTATVNPPYCYSRNLCSHGDRPICRPSCTNGIAT
jgi:hypothetical protein